MRWEKIYFQIDELNKIVIKIDEMIAELKDILNQEAKKVCPDSSIINSSLVQVQTEISGFQKSIQQLLIQINAEDVDELLNEIERKHNLIVSFEGVSHAEIRDEIERLNHKIETLSDKKDILKLMQYMLQTQYEIEYLSDKIFENISNSQRQIELLSELEREYSNLDKRSRDTQKRLEIENSRKILAARTVCIELAQKIHIRKSALRGRINYK